MSNKKIISPPEQRLFGHTLEFKANPVTAMQKWHRLYGDFVRFKLAGKTLYLVSHPAIADEILTKRPDTFVKMYDPQRPKGLALILGQGLVTSQGQLWKQQRKLMQPVFQRSRLQNLSPQIHKAADDMILRWQKNDDGSPLNIADEMMRVALEVITQTMFSTSMLDKIEDIAPALDTGLRFAAASLMNPLALPLWFPTPQNRRFLAARKHLQMIIDHLISERMNAPVKHNDLLQMLLDARDEKSGEKMPKQQIRDELLTIFSAGHETTANLLTWTLYFLSRNPGMLDKVRTEILQATCSSPESTPYLVAVLNESMRLRPPAGVIMRKVKEDCQLQGYHIQKGHLLMISIFNIHHHPEFYSEAEQFKAERFFNKQQQRLSFMPFGAGPRVCIGNHFAMLEARILLKAILSAFHFETIDNTTAEMEMAVTIRPKGGLFLRARKLNP